jgi:alkanesulfonate monooxygenase SsuD/methylene tetrahydromethanopterin reductase-like flavin-dependent oxidoreductase (luciferase family)
VRYFVLDAIPWPHLPDHDDAVGASSWVSCPNSQCEPSLSTPLFESHLDVLAEVERLGFDGVCLPEHQQWPGGLTPAPLLLAAALARATKQMKLAVISTALALGDPLRLATELATLDVLSGGRLVAGFTTGHDGDVFALQTDPTRCQERLRDGLDLVVRCWTTPGPWTWKTPSSFYRYVNPWPTPVQRPHPPLWVVDPGSPATLQHLARHRATFLTRRYQNAETSKLALEAFRAAGEQVNSPPTSDQVGWSVLVYVGASDAAARSEVEPHLRYLSERLLKNPPTAPGLEPVVNQLARLKNRRGLLGPGRTWDEIVTGGFALVGGPATVRDRLNHWRRELGVGVVLLEFAIGSLPRERIRESLHRFASDVLPQVR